MQLELKQKNKPKGGRRLTQANLNKNTKKYLRLYIKVC